MASEDFKAEATRTLEGLRVRGEVAAFYWTTIDRKPTVRLTIIGTPSKEVEAVEAFLGRQGIATDLIKEKEPPYHFLGGELRPGTGIIRRVSGRSEGPSGTLTCFLSSRDSKDFYFAAAGHVATNFWKIYPPDADGSIFLSRKGYPGTNSMRFLGNLCHSSPPPIRMDKEKPEDPKKTSPDLDIALVKVEGKFDLRQRTTCYGHFGEWPAKPVDVQVNDRVMKCGAEETHWTAAVVEKVGCRVLVYGPDTSLYELKHQVILKLPDMDSQKVSPYQQHTTGTQRRNAAAPYEQTPPQQKATKELPGNPPRTPFGVAGDSGSMVVDSNSKRPVGMLIAGSILDGRYVMTPISAISDYWNELNLVLLRA